MERFDVQFSAIDARSIIACCPIPFTGQCDPIDHRLDDAVVRCLRNRRVGPQVLQVGRKFEIDRPIDVRQMDLVEHVPQFVVSAVLIESVPPVPVAALGDVPAFPGGIQTRVGRILLLEVDQRRACLDQALPCKTLFCLAGPGGQGSVDPRSGRDGLDARECVVLCQELRRSGRDDAGVAVQTTVPLVHERTAVVVVLEVGHEHPVLTVERHREQVFARVLSLVEQLLADVVHIGDEVGCCRLR